MRMPSKKSAEAGEAKPTPVLIRCAKCLCEFERERLRKYPSIGGNTQAFVLCTGCAGNLQSAYKVEPHEMGALTMVMSIEREQRERARNDIRHARGEERERLIRQLDVALATAHDREGRVNRGAKDLHRLMTAFSEGKALSQSIAQWAAKYREQWRKDHSLSPELENFFGFGDHVQADQEMATL